MRKYFSCKIPEETTNDAEQLQIALGKAKSTLEHDVGDVGLIGIEEYEKKLASRNAVSFNVNMNLTPLKNKVKDTKVTQKHSMNAEFNGTNPVTIKPNEKEKQMSKRRGKKKRKHKKKSRKYGPNSSSSESTESSSSSSDELSSNRQTRRRRRRYKSKRYLDYDRKNEHFAMPMDNFHHTTTQIPPGMSPKLINPSFGYSQQTFDVDFRMPMHAHVPMTMPQQPTPVHMLPNNYSYANSVQQDLQKNQPLRLSNLPGTNVVQATENMAGTDIIIEHNTNVVETCSSDNEGLDLLSSAVDYLKN